MTDISFIATRPLAAGSAGTANNQNHGLFQGILVYCQRLALISFSLQHACFGIYNNSETVHCSGKGEGKGYVGQVGQERRSVPAHYFFH